MNMNNPDLNEIWDDLKQVGYNEATCIAKTLGTMPKDPREENDVFGFYKFARKGLLQLVRATKEFPYAQKVYLGQLRALRRKELRLRKRASALRIPSSRQRRSAPRPVHVPYDVDAATKTHMTFWTEVFAPEGELGPVESDEDVTAGTMPLFSDDTIDMAINKLKGNSAAGGDGLRPGTLKAFPRVAHRLAKAHLRWLMAGTPKEISPVLVSLLPKTQTADPMNPKNWRPISLWPALGRLVGTCFHSVLRQFVTATTMPKWSFGLHRTQGLLEARMFVQLLLQCAWDSRMPLAVSRLDYARAFDTSTWTGVQQALVARGVPHGVVIALWRSFQTAPMVLPIPGTAVTWSCQPKRSVPQGHPCSPLLFGAAFADMLSGAVTEFEHLDLGFRIGDLFCPLIHYFDDVILFARSPSELRTMTDILERHAASGGWKLNIQKCAWGAWRTEEVERANEPLYERSLDMGFSWLGIFLGPDGDTKEAWSGATQRAWAQYHCLKPHLNCRFRLLPSRVRTLRQSILSIILDVAPHVRPSAKKYGAFTGIQRRMVAALQGLRPRAEESNAQFLKRRMSTARDVILSLGEPDWGAQAARAYLANLHRIALLPVSHLLARILPLVNPSVSITAHHLTGLRSADNRPGRPAGLLENFGAFALQSVGPWEWAARRGPWLSMHLEWWQHLHAAHGPDKATARWNQHLKKQGMVRGRNALEPNEPDTFDPETHLVFTPEASEAEDTCC